jgi:PAS domain S-box-containing protein
MTSEELCRIRAEAMDFANIGLFRYRLDGTVVFFDRGALRLLDLDQTYADPSEVVGKNIGELLEYLDEPGRLRQAVRKEKRVRNFEYRYRTLAGRVRWVYHNSYEVIDATGEVCVQVIAQDITELKETSRALAASEARFRTLAEYAVLGIGVVQGDPPRFVFANDTLAEILGMAHESLVGLPAAKLFGLLQPADQDTLRTLFRVKVSRADVAGDLCLQHEDGQVRWVAPAFSDIVFDGLPAVQVTVVDTTERRQVEERRRVLEEQMRHVQKLESLGVLAGGIAHDFNNLLVGILGNADLAERRLGKDEEVQQRLSEIRKASRRAATLCKQLLAYSGRSRMAAGPFDLNALVLETAELLKLSVSKKAMLAYDLQADLPPAHGDPSHMQQVLMNLIINASEALGDRSGSILLSTGLASFARHELDDAHFGRDLQPGTFLFIEVTDTGSGMDEDTRRRIFEPFFTTKFTGRGLGLAAVLGIVRGHHGALIVDSEPGRGSTFRVLLPPSNDPLRPSEPPGGSLPHLSDRGTVLVVDDEEATRLTICALVRELGFQVMEATHGRDAIRAYETAPDAISLVILDVLMPESDGRECFVELRRRSTTVPVLFNSGHGEEAVASLVARDPHTGFLQKPYDLAMLESAIDALVGTQRRS